MMAGRHGCKVGIFIKNFKTRSLESPLDLGVNKCMIENSFVRTITDFQREIVTVKK